MSASRIVRARLYRRARSSSASSSSDRARRFKQPVSASVAASFSSRFLSDTAVSKAYDFETAVSDKKRLEKLAATDALTGCLNRRALSEELEAELDRARRYNLALTILLADIDRFKLVNDTRGHLAGDSVLRQVGEILRREARSGGLVGRYWGDGVFGVMTRTALHGS